MNDGLIEKYLHDKNNIDEKYPIIINSQIK